MDNTLIIISASVLLVLLVFFLYKKSTSKPSGKIVPPKDPVAQAVYNQQKNQDKEKKLTFAQRMELSWKFLYQITEIIMNKFSRSDQHDIKQVGEILVKNGMKYNHVVDLAIAPIIAKSKNVEIEIGKQQEEGRSI